MAGQRRYLHRTMLPCPAFIEPMPGLRQSVTTTLARELTMRADVSFAFAYGSFVTGHEGFRDIDVAVWLAPGGDRFADVSLATDLSRIVDFPVDARIANAAPVSFLFHVIRGRLLTVRDESLLADVMERTARQYHDQEPLVRLATRDAFGA